MRTAILAIISGVALSLSASAFASEAAKGEQTVSAVPDSQKVVCRYLPHEGSLIPKQYCATQYVWDKRRRDLQQNISEMQLRQTHFRAQ
ncbi:MAG: hypothetical protein ACT4OG_06715 [Alphaproteobacteria bacterium]